MLEKGKGRGGGGGGKTTAGGRSRESWQEEVERNRLVFPRVSEKNDAAPPSSPQSLPLSTRSLFTFFLFSPAQMLETTLTQQSKGKSRGVSKKR